jgi:hypothetical protein
MESYQVVTQTAVNVFISSTVTTFVAEKRFPKNITIGELKVVFLFPLLRVCKLHGALIEAIEF